MGKRCKGKGAFFLILLLGVSLPVFLLSCDGGGGGGNSAPASVADFTGTPTTGDAPLTVAFTDNSTGSPDTWSWDFGDGSAPDTNQNPSHAYVAAGTYDVTLAIDGPGGMDNVTKGGYITVTPPAPVAQFSGTPLSGDSPLDVQFADESTGDISTYFWDFGDFTTSTEQNPLHTYVTADNTSYSVELTVTGPGGPDSEMKSNYITVGVTPPAPVAGFSGTPLSGAAPLTVVFTNQTTGVFDTLSWDFGDNTTSTAPNPSHEYATSEFYTVELTAEGPGGSDTFTEPDYISVTPLAAFSADNTSGTAPLGVQFTDNSTGGAASWLWDFGDGSPTSTLQNPIHTYTVPGMFYEVSLTATGPGGDNTIIIPNFIATAVIPAPVADFSGTPTEGGAPLTVQFTDNSTGDISTYSWDFGDGSAPDTNPNPSHDYDVSSGIYDVTLTVTGPGGSDNVMKGGYITAFSTMYTDDFARADNTTLGDHWTTPSGCSELQVVLDHAQATDNNANNCAYWSWNLFAADQYSQIVGTFVNRGPAVRIQTGVGQPNFYFARATDVDMLQIRKMVDGTPSTLATIPVAPDLTADSVVRLEIVGNTLEVFVDGTPIDTVTDTVDPFTSGAPGMFINVTGINLDEWEGGSL